MQRSLQMIRPFLTIPVHQVPLLIPRPQILNHPSIRVQISQLIFSHPQSNLGTSFSQPGLFPSKASPWNARINGWRSIVSKSHNSVQDQTPQTNKLESNPSKVTTTSSIRPIIEASPNTGRGAGRDTLNGGVQHDLGIIKETFAFREVPKEVLFLGTAGVIPYIFTTASTLFLAWDFRNIVEEGTGSFVSEQAASNLLDILEPVQVGFGAVILSFLGAIHWGLEFAAYGGSSPYRRYFLGILAPALAWPTVFMPYDIALLTQFLGFTGMYFADAQATARGWAPRWYTSYRFLLTFIVGTCIVMTLIGRGKIGDVANIGEASRDKLAKLRRDSGAVTSSRDYRRLIKQEQDIIRKNSEQKLERTRKELTEKEAEYKKAEDNAYRAAQRASG